jgi:hypothetical protein
MPGPDGIVEIIDDVDDDEPPAPSPEPQPDAAPAPPARTPAGPLRTGSIAMVIPAQHLFGA